VELKRCPEIPMPIKGYVQAQFTFEVDFYFRKEARVEFPKNRYASLLFLL
jgi:hypothetical protein